MPAEFQPNYLFLRKISIIVLSQYVLWCFVIQQQITDTLCNYLYNLWPLIHLAHDYQIHKAIFPFKWWKWNLFSYNLLHQIQHDVRQFTIVITLKCCHSFIHIFIPLFTQQYLKTVNYYIKVLWWVEICSWIKGRRMMMMMRRRTGN